MTLTYTVARADYQAFWWASLFHWKTLKQIAIIWLVFSMMVILTDAENWTTKQDWIKVLSNKLLIASGLTVVLLIIFLFRWRNYPLFNGPEGACELEVKPDCFVLKDKNNMKYVFAMNQMRFINQNKDLLFLYFGNRDGFALPKSAFKNDDSVKRFYQIMQKLKMENLPQIAEEAFKKLLK